MIRACFSGSDACTGIAPCDACAKAIHTRVLPKAMVAGGFNGSMEVASKFFDAFMKASDELRAAAPHEMVEAMHGAHANEAVQAEPEEEVSKEDHGLTEDEVSAMGQIQDTVEETDSKPSLSGKNARSMARMARALKKKRAERAASEASSPNQVSQKQKKEQEGTHG